MSTIPGFLQSKQHVGRSSSSNPKHGILPHEHFRLTMFTIPGFLQSKQHVARSSSSNPKDGRFLPHEHFRFLMSTIPGFLHSKQHVARWSSSNPKDGCFLPHEHFRLTMSTIPGFLHSEQHVGRSSSSNPKYGRFLPHEHFRLTMSTIPGFLHSEQHVGRSSSSNPKNGCLPHEQHILPPDRKSIAEVDSLFHPIMAWVLHQMKLKPFTPHFGCWTQNSQRPFKTRFCPRRLHLKQVQGFPSLPPMTMPARTPHESQAEPGVVNVVIPAMFFARLDVPVLSLMYTIP